MPSLALQAQLRSALAEAERILEDDSNPFAVDTSCGVQGKKKPCTASRRLFDTTASKDEVMQYCFLHQLEVCTFQCRILLVDLERDFSNSISSLFGYVELGCHLISVIVHTSVLVRPCASFAALSSAVLCVGLQLATVTAAAKVRTVNNVVQIQRMHQRRWAHTAPVQAEEPLAQQACCTFQQQQRPPFCL